jgi:tetratricopeptide (TPR) repeat protein
MAQVPSFLTCFLSGSALLVACGLALRAQEGAAGDTESGEASADDAAYIRSLSWVREAIERRPGDPELHFILGDVHLRQAQYREAIQAFEKASQLDPRNPRPVLSIATANARRGVHDRAADGFRRLLVKEWPHMEVPARMGLAGSLFESGRFAEAAAEARAVIRLGEPLADVRYLLGRSLEAQVKARLAEGAKAEEIAALEKEEEAVLLEASRIDPGHAAARYLLGTLYRRQGKLDRAKVELEVFRRLKPLRSESNLRRAERAGAEFESRTVLNLSRAAVKAGSAAEALALAERRLASDPGFVELEVHRASVLLQLNRLDEAARAANDILRRDPRNPEALWSLGLVHLRKGENELAAAAIQRSLETRSAFPDGWEVLADLAQEHGVRRERLEEFARHAVQLRPSAENFVRLAMALDQAGKQDECERILRQGLGRHPGHPELETGLQALLLSRSGKR